jgi:glutathione peroxidase
MAHHDAMISHHAIKAEKAQEIQSEESKIYTINVKTINGKESTLASYKGKVLLIVNVASRCGFTPQYTGLEELYKKYESKGFSILGFPCNQFRAQEPGDDAEIKNFCKLKYGVTFPMFSKIDVNGSSAHPLYVYLKKEEPGFLGTEAIKWNFTKFLVDRTGKVLKRFSPNTEPRDLFQDIETALNLKSYKQK